MKFVVYMFALVAAISLAGCSDEVDSSLDPSSSSWSIPVDQVFDGGPGKDGIPALINPGVVAASKVDFLSDEDLVIGIKVGDEVRVYPHIILDWHEIINDDIGNVSVAITYCPLTGSAIGWNRNIDGVNTTFGVSGLLYQTNLMPYDRATNSTWSQMKLESVNGRLIGRNAEIIPVLETSWGTFRKMYPEAKVTSTSTGFNRPYGVYPYGDYKTNHSFLLFPVTPDDNRLPRKVRVFGIIVGDKTKVYRFGVFEPDVSIIIENFNGVDIVVIGSRTDQFIAAYERKLTDDTVLSFTAVKGQLPIVMIDNRGTSWDIFGNGVSGPGVGQKLTPVTSFISFWFAWGAFFPGAEIHGQ